ncbi:hypothetical protein [Variovorax sp. E3]|uniref:hypothetical protein n=1 Tax=Variovorax sp. E3 TaxID=1914993 RepID=UPI0022B5F7B3|nr:hypothetical protein [Variovorax sp. E3]
MLPCKPDRANRALPLGAESVQVDMTGCEAGGATFAIAHASANGPAQAETWLNAWRSATRGQLGEAQVAETPAGVQRATATPPPLRLDAQPPSQGGAPVQVLWFAQSQKTAPWRSTRPPCWASPRPPTHRRLSSRACACRERRLLLFS